MSEKVKIVIEYNEALPPFCFGFKAGRSVASVLPRAPDVFHRHYDTDITSCPGRVWAERGQDWEVNCPTDRGLFASLGFVPTGFLGGGGGSDAGEASDERALRPPGLEAELRGVSASSLEASDSSSSLTSSSEQGDCGVAIGSGTVPVAAARASM